MKKYLIIVFSFLLGFFVASVFFISPYFFLYKYVEPKFLINLPSANQYLNQIKQQLQNVCSQAEKKYDKFEIISNILKNDYYYTGKINENKMIENALKGYVSSLEDPYTIYLTVEENKRFNEDLKGTQEFEGIGAHVTKVEEGIMIENVIKGYPAYKAGLKPLDIILKIDGVSTKDLSLQEAVSKIRGPAGTSVTLTIYRKKNKEIFDITIIREKISLPSVTYEEKIYNGKKYGYINISVFGEDTAEKFKEALLRLKNTEGIIIDLRGNGGGYLEIAHKMASYLIPKDKLIVSTNTTSIENQEDYYSLGNVVYSGKIVILVDGLTASASEILAGSLRDQLGAKIIGTKTFGKCSIQAVEEFLDGSSLKYTIGKWRLPKSGYVCDNNGNPIGIKPDIEIEFNKDEYNKNGIDNQLNKALEIISQ